MSYIYADSSVAPGQYPANPRPPMFGYTIGGMTLAAQASAVTDRMVTVTVANASPGNTVTVYWGDGTTSVVSGGTASHTYAQMGTYVISAVGTDGVGRQVSFTTVDVP
jgi:hypothetical protein